MQRGTKVALWVAIGVISLVVAVPVVGLSLIVGSNFVVGLYSLVFEKQPSMQQMTGVFELRGTGQPSTLTLKQDGSFREETKSLQGNTTAVEGHWTYNYGENLAEITFKPFADPRNGGKEVDYYGVNCYKRRFGSPYMEIDPDTGDRFEKTR